jgi:uncharacterized protein (TIRG00374 family)
MIWLKRAFSLVLLAILIYLFWPLAKELHNLANVFRLADWNWILVALILQFISYSLLANLNTTLLRPFKGKINFWSMMTILPAIAFMEVTIPSAGASGFVVRVRLLGKKGFSAESSTFTAAMEQVFLGVVMGIVALLGLWYMLKAGEIKTFQIVLLVMLIMILFLASSVAIWLVRDRDRLKKVSLWLNHRINQWLVRHKKQALPDATVVRRVDEFYVGFIQLRKQPLLPYLLLALGRVSLDIASMGACFIAFHFNISIGILLTGYGLMLLISGFAALPGGLGMADLSLSIIFARLGAPGAVAVAAALIYRLIAWWLVRFAGFISWQYLETDYAKRPLNR